MVICLSLVKRKALLEMAHSNRKVTVAYGATSWLAASSGMPLMPAVVQALITRPP
jgi:hypothetical protein